MALFVLVYIIIDFLTCLAGFEISSNRVLEITPATGTAGNNVGFYKVDDTLNLTCTFKRETVSPDAILEWVVPVKASNSQNRVIQKPGFNFVTLVINNLQENDSGDYKCRATHNGIPYIHLENSIRITVKKKKECTNVMFQCSSKICIPERYTCDGHKDCPNGEDESPNHCGPGNPCDNKFMCPENRCIPFTWCCESHREPNCTTKIKHSCCTHVEKLTRDVDSDLGYQFEQQRFSDMGFLQTTVYTVIGCAMAFMFIVTIIVIAICRVHVRRTLLTRCPTSNRNLTVERGVSVHGNHLSGLSFYDLDLYFNRSGISGNDLMAVNPLLVTYNINNGVQFVGRPIDPPPYCEIVTSPPKEGPPPPYASQENLTVHRSDRVDEPKPRDEEELSEVQIETEMTETDALLGATGQNISVISSNAIDTVAPPEDFSNSEPLEQTECNLGTNLLESSKESLEIVVHSNSSHCVDEVMRSVDNSKNSGVDILVLGCNSFVTEMPDASLKAQTGESSSFVPGEISDVSKGAIRKIVGVSSIDSSSSSKRKNKSFSKNHVKKF